MINKGTTFTTAKRLVYLEHALDVLETLARTRGEASLSLIARETGVSKAGVHRILATLVHRRYVDRTPSGRYRLALRVWELGCLIPERLLTVTAAPSMDELTSRVCESSFLCVLDGFDVIALEMIECTQTVRVHTQIGARTPAHCTSIGWVLLAYLSAERLNSVLPRTLQQVTPYTVTDRQKLLRELTRVRVRGFASRIGGWREDAGGVAAPVFDRTGAVVAAVGVGAPRTRLSSAHLRELEVQVVKTAGVISTALGFSGQAL